MRVRTVFILVLLVPFLVVIFQNTEVTTIRVLFWDFVMSRIVLLAVSLGIGVVVGLLLGRPRRDQERDASQQGPEQW